MDFFSVNVVVVVFVGWRGGVSFHRKSSSIAAGLAEFSSWFSGLVKKPLPRKQAGKRLYRDSRCTSQSFTGFTFDLCDCDDARLLYVCNRTASNQAVKLFAICFLFARTDVLDGWRIEIWGGGW